MVWRPARHPMAKGPLVPRIRSAGPARVARTSESSCSAISLHQRRGVTRRSHPQLPRRDGVGARSGRLWPLV